MSVTILKTVQPCNKVWNGEKMAFGKPFTTAQAMTRNIDSLEALAEVIRSISDDPCKVWCPGGSFEAYPDDQQQFSIMAATTIRKQLGLPLDADVSGVQQINGRDYVARLKANMQESRVQLFDYDQTDGMPDKFRNMDADSLVAFMRDIFGQGVGFVAVESTSGRVKGTDKAKGWHLYAIIKEPADLVRFKAAWLSQGFISGWSFLKPTHCRKDIPERGLKAGDVCYYVPWSIFDPSVLASCERLDFIGKPYAAAGSEIEVLPATVKTYPGTALDTTLIQSLEPEQRERVKKTLKAKGIALTGTDGFATSVVGGIALNTSIETQSGWMTVQEFLSSQHDKMRCQIPAFIRDSESWNGILRRTKKETAVLIDNGTQTHYFLPDAEVAPLVAPATKKHKSRLFDPKNPLDWRNAFMMTQESMDKIADPEWIYKNLIIRGHLIVIPAPPNGGKTTIMMHLAGGVVADGYTATYVNADISGADAKSAHAQATAGGFMLLLPDFAMTDDGGLSMADVVALLEDTANTEVNLEKEVFIFDTLKKMVDVIQKSAAKTLYKTLRKLTARGATIICLSHTNKYTGEGGELIFEGTGDLRSDCDEMIFLYPKKNANGSMTVSTKPDKVRGTFEPITFDIAKDRTVTRRDKFIDVKSQIAMEKQRKKDVVEIEAINAILKDGQMHARTEIVATLTKDDACRGRDAIRHVLDRYNGREWASQKGDQNAMLYVMLSEAHLLGKTAPARAQDGRPAHASHTVPAMAGVTPPKNKIYTHTPHTPHTPPTQGAQRFPAGDAPIKQDLAENSCGSCGFSGGTEFSVCESPVLAEKQPAKYVEDF